MLNAGETAFINAQMKFRSEFSGLAGFPADNRTNIWLMDADDTILYLVSLVFEHVLLLLVEFLNRIPIDSKLFPQFMSLLNETGNQFNVPADISQLKLDGSIDTLPGWFL